jgi:hypothetical protein
MDVPTTCSSARSASPDAPKQYAPHMRPCRTCTLTRLRLTGSYGASIFADATGHAPASPRFMGRSETLARLRLARATRTPRVSSRCPRPCLMTMRARARRACPREITPSLRAIELTTARFRPRARLPFHTAHVR